jgi:protein O-GlcNAc transferase
MLNIAEALAIGKGHHQAGQLADAERIYRQVLAVEPSNPQALHQMGILALKARCFEEAKNWIGQAVATNPSQAAFHANLGEAYRLTDQTSQAIGCYRRALSLRPDLTQVLTALGTALRAQGKPDEAAEALREVLRLKPEDIAARVELGHVLLDQNQPAEAESCFRQVVRALPESAPAQFSLGTALQSQNQFEEAAGCFRSAVQLTADNALAAHAYTNLGGCLQTLGMQADAVACFRQVVALDPKNSLITASLPHSLHYPWGPSPQAIFDEHVGWARRHSEPLAPPNRRHENDPTPQRRLKIGYVSPYFRAHAISLFIEPILAAHDHRNFEVVCYSDGTLVDFVTERFRGYADTWVNTAGQCNAEFAERVVRDRIDILIDLTGHLPGNRLLAFARQPAPIQVTYLGYQNTTGLSAMNYRLTDEFADPAGMTDRYYTEALVRLPRAFFCYQPLSEAPNPGVLPALARGHVTFGSFNKFAKVTPEALSAWAQVLARVPGSRMIILAEAGHQVARRVHEFFAREGVSPDRVEIAGPRPRRDYLLLNQQVDITLDSFPFNGHTTICESLWMGVPAIVLVGQTYASRFGGSALVHLGLNDLIADSSAKYVDIATKLAVDLQRLMRLRGDLRGMMLASPLLDARGFTRNLEAVFRQMWTEWCARRSV